MPAALALIISYIIWGAAPPLFKYALDGIPPFSLAFIRFFFAGLILWPLARAHWQKISGWQMKDIVVGAVFGITINITFFFLGLQYSQSINVHIIGSLSPVLLYFLSISMLREKPHPQIIKGMMISLLGVAFIVLMPLILAKQTDNQATSTSLFYEVIGNIFFIVSTLGGVLHTIHTKRVLKYVNSYVVTFIGFMISSVTFFPLMVYEISKGQFHTIGFNAWVGIIYGVLFSSALAYYLFSYGISKMRAQEAGIFAYISPVVAVLVAIPVLGEYPDIYFLIGSCLVFIGIILSEKHTASRKVLKKSRR